MKTLLENKNQIATEISNFQLHEVNLQNAKAAFDKLNLGVPFTSYLLVKLRKDTEATVREILMSKIPDKDKATGLKIDKENAIKGLKMPDLRELKNLLAVTHIEHLDYFKFGETVSLDEDKLDSYLNKYRVLATSKEVEKLFNTVTDLQNTLQSLSGQVNGFVQVDSNNNVVGGIYELFYYKNNRFEIRMDAFRALRTKLVNI